MEDNYCPKLTWINIILQELSTWDNCVILREGIMLMLYLHKYSYKLHFYSIQLIKVTNQNS
jgi:hypothetical protein